MVSNALVRRKQLPGVIAGRAAAELARSLGANDLAVLAARHGMPWVMQQVSNGALRVTKAARSWLTSAPTPVGDVNVQSAPAATSLTLVGNRSLNGSITLRHRELVSTSHVANTLLRSWVINPGNGTFPYLSTIARNYDKYCFKNLRFFVVSSAPTSVAGRYYLSWEPDSEDTVPGLVAGLVPAGPLMAAQHSISTSLWQTAGIGLPAMRSDKLTGPFPDALKDHGRLIFAATSSIAVTLELYAEYTVELRQPQVGDSVEILDGTIFESASLGSPLGVQIVRAESTKKLRFPPGNYRIDYTVKGTGITRVTNSVVGQDVQKHIGSAVSTTEANEISLIRGSGEMVYSINDTWTTLSDASVMITPLSFSAWESLYDNLP